MKDVFLYVFLFALYAVLALKLFALPLISYEDTLTWEILGRVLLTFIGSAVVARWSVLAFKKRPPGLLAGQKIIGIEEQQAENVLDVLKPQKLRREEKKPKLKRRKFL